MLQLVVILSFLVAIAFSRTDVSITNDDFEDSEETSALAESLTNEINEIKSRIQIDHGKIPHTSSPQSNSVEGGELCARRAPVSMVDPHYPNGGGIPMNEWLQPLTDEIVKYKRSLGLLVDDNGEDLTTTDEIRLHNERVRRKHDRTTSEGEIQKALPEYPPANEPRVTCGNGGMRSPNDPSRVSQNRERAHVGEQPIIAEDAIKPPSQYDNVGLQLENIPSFHDEVFTWRAGAELPETALGTNEELSLKAQVRPSKHEEHNHDPNAHLIRTPPPDPKPSPPPSHHQSTKSQTIQTLFAPEKYLETDNPSLRTDDILKDNNVEPHDSNGVLVPPLPYISSLTRPPGLTDDEYAKEIENLKHAAKTAEELTTKKTEIDPHITSTPVSATEQFNALHQAIKKLSLKKEETHLSVDELPLDSDQATSKITSLRSDTTNAPLYETRIEKLAHGRPLSPADVRQLNTRKVRQLGIYRALISNLSKSGHINPKENKQSQQDSTSKDQQQKDVNVVYSSHEFIRDGSHSTKGAGLEERALDGDFVLIKLDLFILDFKNNNLLDCTWRTENSMADGTRLRHLVSGLRAFQLGSPCMSLSSPNYGFSHETEQLSSNDASETQETSNIYIPTPFLTSSDYEPQNRYNTLKGIHEGLRGALVSEKRTIIINGDAQDFNDLNPTESRASRESMLLKVLACPTNGWPNAFGAKGNARLRINPYTRGPFLANVTLLSIRRVDEKGVDDNIFESLIHEHQSDQSRREGGSVPEDPQTYGQPHYNVDLGECIVGTQTLFSSIEEAAEKQFKPKLPQFIEWANKAESSFEDFLFGAQNNNSQAFLLMTTKDKRIAEKDIQALSTASSLYRKFQILGNSSSSILDGLLFAYHKKVVEQRSIADRNKALLGSLSFGDTEKELEQLLRGPLLDTKNQDKAKVNFGSTRYNPLFVDVSDRIKKLEAHSDAAVENERHHSSTSSSSEFSSVIKSVVLDLNTNPLAYKYLTNPQLLSQIGADNPTNNSHRFHVDGHDGEGQSKKKRAPIAYPNQPKLYVILRKHGDQNKNTISIYSLPQSIKHSRTSLDYLVLLSHLHQLVHASSMHSPFDKITTLELFSLIYETQYECDVSLV